MKNGCRNIFSVQVDELAKIKRLDDDLEELYHNNIGTLRDIFDIEIPLRFSKEYDYLWSPETVETVQTDSGVIVEILDMVRLQAKPYSPEGVQDIRNRIGEMEKAIVADMQDRFLECACPGKE